MTVKKGKGKSDILAKVTGARMVKSFHLHSLFLLLFHFLIYLTTNPAGGRVDLLVCDYCFLFPRLSLYLGTAGTVLKGEMRTKCTTLLQAVDVPLKERGKKCNNPF